MVMGKSFSSFGIELPRSSPAQYWRIMRIGRPLTKEAPGSLKEGNIQSSGRRANALPT
jgi:hypothetical protein